MPHNDLVEAKTPETPVEVTPKAGAQVPAEPAEPAEPAAPATNGKKKGSINQELLRIPAMQALMAGSPPAVSAPLEAFAKRPEAKLFVQNKDDLLKAGLAFYKALSGDLGVVFNQLYISGDEIKKADQAGQLTSIAPPFDSVNQAVSQAGPANPVLSHQGVPGAFKQGPVPTPPQAATGGTVPPATSGQRRIAETRAKQMQAGSPTSGPRPGAGRLLNQILKPVV